MNLNASFSNRRWDCVLKVSVMGIYVLCFRRWTVSSHSVNSRLFCAFPMMDTNVSASSKFINHGFRGRMRAYAAKDELII
jgi:hypothetical protein